MAKICYHDINVIYFSSSFSIAGLWSYLRCNRPPSCEDTDRKNPCIDIGGGSTHTNDWRLSPLSKPRLPVATWRHRSATVMFSVTRTSHYLLHPVVVSKRGISEGCSYKCSSYCPVDRGVRPASNSENTVSVTHFNCETLFTLGDSPMAASDILPHSKLFSVPVFLRSLCLSVRGEGTYRNHMVKFRSS